MKKIVSILFTLSLIFVACKKPQKLDVESFKYGTFEIPATDEYSKTIIIRKDSLQIEIYEGKVDTLLIEWKDNFNYTLNMLNMMNGMEEDPIHVQITRVKADSYDFNAVIGHSNFKQDGTVYKIND